MTMIKLLLVMMPWLDYTSSWTEAHRDLLSTFYFTQMIITVTRMEVTITMRIFEKYSSRLLSLWLLRGLSLDNFPRLSNLGFISSVGIPHTHTSTKELN